MERIEDLYDLLVGHWQGTYTQGRRTFSDELGFLGDSKIESASAISTHAFGRDRAGHYDARGTLNADGSFSFTRRRGYMRGTIDLATKTMTGGWGLNQRRYDGTFSFTKDEGESDRQRVADRQRQRQGGNTHEQEQAARFEAEAEVARVRLQEQATTQKRQDEAAAAQQKREEEEAARIVQEEERETAKRKLEREEASARQRVEKETARKQREEDEARRKAVEDDKARKLAQATATPEMGAEELAKYATENPTSNHSEELEAAKLTTVTVSKQHVEASTTETVGTSGSRKPAETSTQQATEERKVADTVRIFKPRKARQMPIKLDESVDIDTYIKVMTALRGDKAIGLL